MGKTLGAALALAARQAGTFSTTQTEAGHPTAGHLRWAVEHGLIRHEGRTVFSVTGAPRDWIQRLWLAELAAGEGSAITCRAVAQLHGMQGFRDDYVQVIRREPGRSHRLSGHTLRTTFWLPDQDVVVVQGLRVTSVARTVFDLAGDPIFPNSPRHPVRREIHKRWVARVLNRCLAHHGLTMSEEVRVLAALGRERGVRGTRIIREIVHDFGTEYVPTETGLEDSVLDLIRDAGLGDPEKQVDMSDEHGWIGRVDFLCRAQRLIIEADGPDHDTPLQRRIDRERDERLRAAGWTVVRVHWSDVIDHPARVLRHLEQLRAA